jgi:hypothetical protein
MVEVTTLGAEAEGVVVGAETAEVVIGTETVVYAEVE